MKIKLRVVQNIVLVSSVKAKDDPRIVDVPQRLTVQR